jgi:hypothetical protein
MRVLVPTHLPRPSCGRCALRDSRARVVRAYLSGPKGGSENLRQVIALTLMLGITPLSACGGSRGDGSAISGSPSWGQADLPVNLIELVAVRPLDPPGHLCRHGRESRR